MEYNTALPKLEMREYGRNIQKLILHCIAIEDREERNKCALAIAEIMTHLFPDLKGDETDSKVWDQMNIISGYKLDIDFPCEVINKDTPRPEVDKIPYSRKSDKYRAYGGNIVNMIREIGLMDGGVEKDRLIFLVANQMKKLLVSVNSDSATDRRVFNDIREISKGRIDIDPESYKLNEYIGVNNQDNKKKKTK